MTDDAQLAALLTEIRDELRSLNAKLTPPPRPTDAAAITLLREIVAAVNDHTFAASDLLRRIPSPDDKRLRAAIVAACGSLAPKRIGQLLRRYEGRTVSGMRVVRIGVERDGAIWQIVVA